MTDGALCRRCRFFHPEVTTNAGDGHGECRAQPPRILIDDGNHTGRRLWPAVFENDWCGAFVADNAEDRRRAAA